MKLYFTHNVSYYLLHVCIDLQVHDLNFYATLDKQLESIWMRRKNKLVMGGPAKKSEYLWFRYKADQRAQEV